MWEQGRWTHEPAHVEVSGSDILVTAVEGSDAWRITSYGFIHDSEHALLAAFPDDSAVEVEFTAAFSEQFDQAGVFVRFDDEHWVKAGIEYADGACQVGAVVTNGTSDWSVAPVPQWRDRRVLVRVSRSGNAMTVRAGLADPGRPDRARPRLEAHRPGRLPALSAAARLAHRQRLTTSAHSFRSPSRGVNMKVVSQSRPESRTGRISRPVGQVGVPPIGRAGARRRHLREHYAGVGRPAPLRRGPLGAVPAYH